MAPLVGHPRPAFGPRVPRVLSGVGERAEWSGNGDIVEDKPVCTFKIAFPETAALPPPRYTASARAEGIVAPFLNPLIIRQARVQLLFWCSYVVDCKNECQGPVPVQLEGRITGLQSVRGQGTAKADLSVSLAIDPFNNVGFAPGAILVKNYVVPFRVGGPFNFPFADTGVVPCCKPQDIEAEVIVEATADFAALSRARVKSLEFTISAQDPPGKGSVRQFGPVRSSITPQRRPADPRAARGFSVRPLPSPPGGRSIIGVAADESGLSVLAVAEHDEESRPQLFRLAFASKRYSRPVRPGLETWGRLLRLPSSTGRGDAMCAFDLGPRVRATGAPRRRGGRLVQIDKRGRTTLVARGFDLPSDAAALDGDPTSLVVSEVTTGRIFLVGSGGRRQLIIGGLEFPLALAAPLSRGRSNASFYVAEAGPVGSESFAPGQGRIRAVDLAEQEATVAVADVGVVAIAISPGGSFGDDLLFATANGWTPDGKAEPNSGRVLALSPSGKITSVISAVDDPVDLCFSPSGRCFLLAAAGLYELSR